MDTFPLYPTTWVGFVCNLVRMENVFLCQNCKGETPIFFFTDKPPSAH